MKNIFMCADNQELGKVMMRTYYQEWKSWPEVFICELCFFVWYPGMRSIVLCIKWKHIKSERLYQKKFILELWFSWDNTHEWRVMCCIQTRIRAITDESIIIWNDGVNQNCSFENFITPHVIFRNETYYSL